LVKRQKLASTKVCDVEVELELLAACGIVFLFTRDESKTKKGYENYVENIFHLLINQKKY